MLTHCFICTASLPSPSSPRPHVIKKGRGRPQKAKEELKFNCGSQLDNGLKVGLPPISYKTLLKHLLANYDGSGVKNDIYDGIVNSIGSGESLLKFCGNCDKLARDIGDLELELEVIQMRLVEKVRLAREAVIRSHSEGQKVLLSEDPVVVLGKEVEFLEVLRIFQTFVAENDTIGKPIPLVYLGKLKPTEKYLSNTLETGCRSVSVKGESVDEAETGDNENVDCVMDVTIEREDVDIKEQFFTAQGGITESEEDTSTDDDDMPLQKASLSSRGPKGRVLRTKTTPKRRRATTRSLSGKQRTPRKYERRNGTLEDRSVYNYSCDVCKFETRTPSRMEQHLREHEVEFGTNSSDKSFTCSHCDLKFLHVQYRDFHEKLHTYHSFKCELCESIIIPLKMKEHLELIHKKSANFCDCCSLCFPSMVSLAKHCINHKGSKLSCIECQPPKLIGGPRPFLRHLVDQHNHTDFLIPCDVPSCTKMFVDTFEKTSHRNFHTKRFKCEKCDKLFPTRTALKIHNVTIHERNKMPFQCDLCGEKYAQKQHLQKHKIVKHSESMIPCPLCPQKFTCVGILDRHKKVHHDDNGTFRKFTCSFENCGKQFIRQSELNRHLPTHSNVNQFTCEVCGFSTKTEELLKGHAKIHNDKMHICSYCGKGFAVIKYLRNHMRIHTEEKPFLCSLCGASFHQRGSLRLHRKKHQDDFSRQ